jgi:hypothetical protein
LEEIVTRIGKTSASIKTLKDIAEKETKKSPTNKTGFSHNPLGYHVEFYNGSEIFTLNGSPDHNRSKRASMVFFDEAAFCSDELIAICEAFATQNTGFITSIEDDYNPETEKRRCPTQLVYASSQDDMDKMFYKHYKNFAKRMYAGDRDYFVCDMICDTAIQTYMSGKSYIPLLTQDKVDAAIKANKDKAMREYYNQPTRDGGVNQIVKWSTIRRSEKFHLPQLTFKPKNRIVLAFDPARTVDNSILSTMNIYEDENYGLCGDIINCVNMIDLASKKKYKQDSNRQLKEIRDTLLVYNGQAPDYEYIERLLIDSGSGGGGTSTYADGLLNDWVDDKGTTHRGLIDADHEIYTGYRSRYPNASDKLTLLNPKKYRTQMVKEFIELMDLGVIKFPYEFKGSESILIPFTDKNGEEQFESYELSRDEMLALSNIDLMKTEITSIYKYENQEKTTVTYALSKEKENRLNDDRFYTAIMLAHYLYGLRRGSVINKPRENKANPASILQYAKKASLYRRKEG